MILFAKIYRHLSVMSWR